MTTIPVSTSEMPVHPRAAGCWLQLNRIGPRGHGDVVLVARNYGFVLDPTDARVLDGYMAGEKVVPDLVGTKKNIDVVERVMGDGGLVDSGVEWLNTQVAPEGYRFGWYEGDFMLWSDETWKARLP